MATPEENFEVAKLAKMVGQQLHNVDALHLDRRNVPANRINMQQFVAQITNPQQAIRNASGYVPEAFVQKSVPDVSLYSKPIELIPQPPPVAPQHIPTPQPVQQPNNLIALNGSDNEIKAILERIANSLEKIVEHYVKTDIIEEPNKKLLNE